MHPNKVIETVIGWDSTESLEAVAPGRWLLANWRGKVLPPTFVSCRIDEVGWNGLVSKFESRIVFPGDSEELGAMKLLMTHFDEIIDTMGERFEAPFEISLEADGLNVSGAPLEKVRGATNA